MLITKRKTVGRFALIALLSLNASLATAGGASGGGGNVIEDSPTTPSQIRQVLEGDWQTPMKMIGHHLQRTLNFTTYKPDIPLKAKLFPRRGPNFFSIIKLNPKLTLIEKGACKVKEADTGKEVERDAGILHDQSICMSLERIAAKSRSSNFFVTTMALLTHEVSHYLKTTEREAEMLAQIVKTNLKNEVHWQLHNYFKNFESSRKSLSTGLSNVPVWIDRQDVQEPMVCAFLGSLQRDVYMLERDYSEKYSAGLGFLKVNQIPIMTELLARAGNILNYCYHNIPGFAENVRSSMDKRFDDKNEIDMATYIKRYGWVGEPYNKGSVIYRIEYLDKPDLKIELGVMKDLVEKLKETSRY